MPIECERAIDRRIGAALGLPGFRLLCRSTPGRYPPALDPPDSGGASEACSCPPRRSPCGPAHEATSRQRPAISARPISKSLHAPGFALELIVQLLCLGPVAGIGRLPHSATARLNEIHPPN